MEKKFKHEKVEACGLCGKVIKTDKDTWAAVCDYTGNKNTKNGFYHRQCLIDHIKGNMKMAMSKVKSGVGAIMNRLMRGEVPNVNNKDDPTTKKLVEILGK